MAATPSSKTTVTGKNEDTGEETREPFVVPASFAQQRLWFINQFEPGSPVYNVSQAYRVKGRLDVAALESSLNEIVQRHESLRTTFALENGEPVQVIAPRLELALPVLNLEAWAADEGAAEVLELARGEAQRPFDLERGPLLRASLLRLGEEEHVFLLIMHHIVVDEWSMEVFFHELEVIYGATIEGRPSPLSELPVQYADFAVWQWEWLQGEVFEEQLAYWKRKLAGLPPALELPADHPRPPAQSFRGARQARMLPASLLTSLQTLSQQEGSTLFMTLLAAFKVLLYRYTGLDDIAVGTATSNRALVELEGLIGFFPNTLVLRSDLSGNPSFRDLLGTVRNVALDAYGYQDLPFEQLVERLKPERDPSRTPLVQVAFSLQGMVRRPASLPGLVLERVDIETGVENFDLTLFVRPGSDGLRVGCRYSTDLFEAARIERLLGHFERLLSGIAADPDRPIGLLPLLTDGERHQIVVEWNETGREYPRDACVHWLFETQAERTPDDLALDWQERRLSYGELNRRANQLAHYLRGLGVGPAVPVGLCVERSPEMVVAMLGILKAGGTYVPLDPSYPRERLALMLEDTRAPVVLTQEHLVAAIVGQGAEAICLDQDWEKIGRESEENPVNRPEATDLAYVMYTSGSTGSPKGVGVPHRAIIRLVCNTDYVHLRPGDRIAQASTVSFDAATFEIWGALLNGGVLVGVPADVMLSPGELAARIRQQQIDVLFLTTALFNELAALDATTFRMARDLLFGGENVDPLWVREVLRNGPPRRLLHVYGPTESTTFTTWHEVQEVAEGARTVPIGRPVANTQVYLLDGNLQPVPVGVPGELYIGGDGLAVGYWSDADLTRAKFVPDPFSGDSGSRLYRTGDLARYLPDGIIEFIGRRDHQVKLRGFRIELGEIEAVLGQHPGVGEAVVVVREERPGDRRLVGYVVGKGEVEPEGEELRQFLRDRLPEYMVPAVLVRLDDFPLTPSGKVDRSVLPAPQREQRSEEGEVLVPRDAVELRLTRMWEALLGVQPVGLQDDFFEVGGHSLLAVRLFAEIEQTFGKKLPVAILFREPTIEGLAEVIRREDPSVASSSLVVIQPGGSNPPFFCVHAFGGSVLRYRELASLLGPDQPVYGLQAKGLDGREAPHTRIEDMAEYYIEAVRDVQPTGPYYLGGFCYAGLVAFEMARQLYDQGEQVGLVALFDAEAPLPRGLRAPLWHPASAFRFLCNLPAWMSNNPPHRYGQVLKRTQARLWRKAGIAWRRWVYGAESPQARFSIEDLLGDLSHISEGARNVADAHLTATRRYRPAGYPGRITLFRARALPVFRPHDPDMGWGRLVAGGVEIKIIPGDHNNFLKKPYVEDLATVLKSSLQQAQAMEQVSREPNSQGNEMSTGEREDEPIYKVVVNHEKQYSIWPVDRENALGWLDVGKTGTKAECLAYIGDVWTDMRPLTLQKRMGPTGRQERRGNV